MKFCLLDKITEYEKGTRIVATKAVSLAEEYLGDHFPTFPVLPGVLVLQAFVEAATLLVQDAYDFQAGVVLLKESRNVTFKSFVQPGETLRVDVQCISLTPHESDFKGIGYCEALEVVRARFALTHRSISPHNGAGEERGHMLADSYRQRFQLLRGHAFVNQTLPTADASRMTTPLV